MRHLIILCALITSVSAHSFEWLQAIDCQTPILEGGVKKLDLIWQERFFLPGDNRSELPRKERVQLIAKSLDPKITQVVLDVELWPLSGNSWQINKSVKKYVTLIQWFKEANPTVKVGYYGLVPVRYYPRAAGVVTEERKRIRKINDELRPISDSVDILFPSLYTLSDDHDSWAVGAAQIIAEARRLAPMKPLYPFLWPRFHESVKRLARSVVPPIFWSSQLTLVRSLADGAVIWDGYWFCRADDPWVAATVDFAQKHP